MVIWKDVFHHVIAFFHPTLPDTCLIFDLDKVKVKITTNAPYERKDATKITYDCNLFI